MSVTLSALLLLCPTARPAQRPAPARTAAPEVRLPARVVRLGNGLTLLMQPDASLPVVGVEVWVRGGSREEAPGQFGVAHLFEHHLPSSGRFFRNAENRALYTRTSRNGNAGTEPDFVRFYGEVTPEGLEALLGAQADRLESDPKGFTAERLKRDQDIVVNELRRSANTEWDIEVRALLQRGTFGAEHPYGHATGGSEAEVRAATPELLQDWHRRFAGASNAFVLVSGNFDPAAAEAMVRRHFGSIRPGDAAARATEWVPRARPLREVVEKEVGQGTVYLRWPVPAWGTAAGDYLGLLASVLAQRLSRRAAEPNARLSAARAEVELWELAGAFTLRGGFEDATAGDGVTTLLRAELERLLREGPTPSELARAKAQSQSEFVRMLQQPAWRGGRTDVLGLGLLYRGDPDHYRASLARTSEATPEAVAREGRRWLSEPGYVLHVLPRPSRKAAGSADRGATVKAADPKPAAFPEVQDATLPNGMRLLLAERTQLPLTQLTFAFEAGAATDDAADSGRARVTLNALARQASAPDGTTLREALEALGAKLDTRLDEDFAALSLSVLSDRVEEAVRLVGAALARDLNDTAIREARAEALRELDATLKDPLRLRVRALACALDAGAACNPGALDGAGTRAGLGRLTPESVRRFYAERYRPSKAVLTISGDIKRERVAALLARAFPGRAARGDAAAPAGLRAREPRPGGFVVVDHPGATQAYLLLALPLPPGVTADPLRAELLSRALRTRLADNLRGSKGWIYDVYPFGVEARRRGALMTFFMPIQLDKTAEAVAEIRAELKRLRDETVSKEFMDGAKSGAEGGLVTGALTSLAQLNAQLLEIARGGRPTDYYAGALAGLRKLTPEDLRRAAQEMLDAERLVWVIAGDRAAVERELREAGVEDFRVVGPADVP
ncbi:MAG TPA: insulinase family protein [Pyrinomonadaceae bacterium]